MSNDNMNEKRPSTIEKSYKEEIDEKGQKLKDFSKKHREEEAALAEEHNEESQNLVE
jgi:hypothetical protein